MAKKPTVAITGASGFVGSALVSHFADLGWNVRGLVRNPAKQHPSNQNVSYHKYDISTPIDPISLQGADYLVHAAYVTEKDNEDAYNINVTGAKLLIKTARSQGVGKLLFISSMSSHEGATSTYGRQKLAIEKLFLAVGGICVRPGLIIGDGGIVMNMAAFMRRWHVVPLIGDGKQPVQIISVRDLAACIEGILTKNLVGTLTLATPRVYTYREFYRTLALQKKIHVIFLKVPYDLLAFFFKVAAGLHLPLKLGVDNLRGLQALKSADSRASLEQIGIQLQTLEEAINDNKSLH